MDSITNSPQELGSDFDAINSGAVTPSNFYTAAVASTSSIKPKKKENRNIKGTVYVVVDDEIQLPIDR